MLLVVALAGTGCAMSRHREQIRQGLLTRGLHREAFVKEWGQPSRTFAVRSGDAVLRTYAFSARWERPVFEVWEYQDRATCLTFDGVRLERCDMLRRRPAHRTGRPAIRRSTCAFAGRS